MAGQETVLGKHQLSEDAPTYPPADGVDIELRENVPMLDLTQLSNSSNSLLANFRGLVLFAIEAKFRNQILVGKLLTRSIRFTFLCTSRPQVSMNFVKNVDDFSQFFKKRARAKIV